MQAQANYVKVLGKPMKELPKDLYIPPDAMLVILELFEGPLDLLLYLIRKNNLNIVDIPVAAITQQYIDYVENMRFTNLELAGDYLEIAAILIEIKSRMLLPVLHTEEENATDPRAELVLRLQQYEQIKQAALNLDVLPRQNRDYFIAKLPAVSFNLSSVQPVVHLDQLLSALQQVLTKKDLEVAHTILGENLSIRDKMTHIITSLRSLVDARDQQSLSKFFMFSDFFNSQEGRLGVVVTFMAILELVKENLLEILQSEHCAPIYIRLATV